MTRHWLANPTPPDPSDLPSKKGLIRASVGVLVLAIVIVLAVVLPAELGLDLTGFGAVTGLEEMGEFKVQAAREFAAIEAALEAAEQASDSAAEPNIP